jgi:hypothetical protein
MKKLNSKTVSTLGYLGVSFIIIGFMVLIGAGCGGDSSESKTGNLSVSLSDKATDEYQAVYVTISEVSVQMEGGAEWLTVATPNKTYNLLELTNCDWEELGIRELGAGHYTQIRLLLGISPDNGQNILGDGHLYANYVIDMDGEQVETTVPSGYQTGIKLVQGFDIEEGATTSLGLDFDASKSVVEAGNSGKLILKPTIKVTDIGDAPVVMGTIHKADGTAFSGVYVSAQISDSSLALKDQVMVSAGTITNASGEYCMSLEQGKTYNIVAYENGYLPAIIHLPDVANGAEMQDMTLTALTALDPQVATITISGSVTISGDSATISARTGDFKDIDGMVQNIEVLSVSFVESGDYTMDLPQATYDIVGYDGSNTMDKPGISGNTADLNFAF